MALRQAKTLLVGDLILHTPYIGVVIEVNVGDSTASFPHVRIVILHEYGRLPSHHKAFAEFCNIHADDHVDLLDADFYLDDECIHRTYEKATERVREEMMKLRALHAERSANMDKMIANHNNKVADNKCRYWGPAQK